MKEKGGEKQAGTKNGTPKTKFGSHVGQSLASSSTPRKEKYHMEKTEEASRGHTFQNLTHLSQYGVFQCRQHF